MTVFEFDGTSTRSHVFAFLYLLILLKSCCCRPVVGSGDSFDVARGRMQEGKAMELFLNKTWPDSNFTANAPCQWNKALLKCNNTTGGIDEVHFSGLQLRRQIPSGSIGNLTELVILDLSNNSLTGPLPDDFRSLIINLQILNMSSNVFTGGLHDLSLGFTRKSTLRRLDLSVNLFNGSIPTPMGLLHDLEVLNLSLNNLSGEIPPSLTNLTFLSSLNVSFNNLSGPVPVGSQFSTFTNLSYIGNPGLCGNPLISLCEAPYDVAPGPIINSLPPVPTISSCPGDECKGLNLKAVITSSIVGGSVVIALLSILGWLVYRRRRRGGRDGPILNENLRSKPLELVEPLTLTENELVKATSGFSPDTVIGVGSQTTVYKAVLSDGDIVAAKVLHLHNIRAETEFYREVNTLGILRHRNILRVLGLCSNMEIKAIILEFMSNGSLLENLHRDEVCGLTWRVRLNIALGVAQGMVYLHHEFHNPLIHCDLNPSNILLDDNLEAKISDFGLRKFGHWGEGGDETFASVFCGTTGYIPGEYGTSSRVSTKGDVYSYGVVILELLTRKQPVKADFGQHGDLLTWARDAFSDRALEIVDQDLLKDSAVGSTQKQQMVLLMRVGLLCTQELPGNRPSMGVVLNMVKQIREIAAPKIVHSTVDDLANAP